MLITLRCGGGTPYISDWHDTEKVHRCRGTRSGQPTTYLFRCENITICAILHRMLVVHGESLFVSLILPLSFGLSSTQGNAFVQLSLVAANALSSNSKRKFIAAPL